MAVITLDKIIFRNNDSYLKMYKGSELIAEVESTPAPNYLTFTALEENSTVNFNRTGVTSEYSTDNGSTWASGDNVTVTLSNVGDKVMCRGVTSTTSGSVTTTAFTLTGQIKASGNVNGMINNDLNDTSLNSKEYAFMNYFRDQSALKDISELVLPATTLTRSCYQDMFRGCTGITTIPANLLPATTLARSCYQSMFRGCTGITTVPENFLPATTLDSYCYQYMFQSCASLTTAPTLPATTLASYCYYHMFQSCASLTTAPTLPATTLASYCYMYMFSGCTKLNKVVTYATNISANKCLNYWLNNVASTGTFYNLGGASYSSGNNGIPSGWAEIKNSNTLNYLTFTATTSGAGITFYRPGVTSEYSTDGGTTWTNGDNVTVTLSNVGDKVMYRGITSDSEYSYSDPAFVTSYGSTFNVSGNIMSMINKDYTQEEFVNGQGPNYGMFHSYFKNTEISSAIGLKLPATTLKPACYKDMFYGCTNLTIVQDNLLTAATTLATDCYNSMFYGCTELTTAPIIPPFTGSGQYAFSYMFYGCTKLNKVISNVIYWDSNNSDYWLSNVSSTGDFYNLGGATYPSDASGIPSGWTVHTTL